MSRYCFVSCKGVMSGNNVSHANNKTRRRFLPNIKNASLYSESLKKTISVRLSTHGIRTIDHVGGIDQYLQKTKDNLLPKHMLALKKLIISKSIPE